MAISGMAGPEGLTSMRTHRRRPAGPDAGVVTPTVASHRLFQARSDNHKPGT